MMKRLKWLHPRILLCAFFLLSTSAQAGVVVVMHKSAGVKSVSKSDVKKIFLGKKRSLPGAGRVKPVDQKGGSKARKQFYAKVVKKRPSQIKAYWSKMIFSGRGTPPKQVRSDSAVKRWLADNPGAIGYIDSKSVDGSVKVVLKVN